MSANSGARPSTPNVCLGPDASFAIIAGPPDIIAGPAIVTGDPPLIAGPPLMVGPIIALKTGGGYGNERTEAC
jgi:hypothetical protein